MKAIYKRELNSYFNSMVGPVVLALMLCFGGIYFMAYNLNYGYPYFSYALGSMRLVLLMVAPVLTMRSMAEDRRNKTDQLWLTAPVTVAEVILGKFFAMATVVALPMVVLMSCPMVIALSGTAYLLADYCTFLAFYLMALAYVAIGMFMSSLTESQMISAITSFGVLLVLYLWEDLLGFLPTGAMGSLVGFALLLAFVCSAVQGFANNWIVTALLALGGTGALVITYLKDSSSYAGLLAEVLGKFNLNEPISNFAYYQVLDLQGLLLYLSFIALMLFLTVQVVQKRRWN